MIEDVEIGSGVRETSHNGVAGDERAVGDSSTFCGYREETEEQQPREEGPLGEVRQQEIEVAAEGPW